MIAGDAQIDVQHSIFTGSNGSNGIASTQSTSTQAPTALPVVRMLAADNTYLTALAATSAAVPIVAAMVTVSAYIAPFPKTWHVWIAVPLGAIITVIVWFICALPCRRFASALYANRCSYGSLINQWRDLRARLQVLDARQKANPNDPVINSDTCKIALQQIHAWCDDIAIELRCKGLCWLLATGYLNMWRLLHHAEEAMIEVEPLPAVLNKAVHDELCLQGANIKDNEVLLDKLRTAVKVLSPPATRYLSKRPREEQANLDTQSEGTPDTQDQAVAELQARATLREIRSTINDYRDSLWEGLILSRNRLMMIVVITGFLAYILLCLPVLNNISPDYVVAATVFFLVGAIIGLFNRLHLETQTNNAINDYGLSMARVIATPVLSGLAAVASVLVIALLTGAIQKGLDVGGNVTDIYIINPLHLLLAAIFGLAPNLLVSMLQQKAESYKSDIQSSKAT